MLGKRRWLSLALVMALAIIGLSASAGADSGSENDFLSRINASRAAEGLGPLKMDGGLQTFARKHTGDMIAKGDIYHSSSAELKGAAGSGWTKLGENVGVGGTVKSLHQAFMNSSGHRANILGDYTHVGIGTQQSGDRLWVTVVFMKKGSTSAPAATTTTTAPKSSGTTQAPSKPSGGSGSTSKATTTTTAAPTTTTTTLPPTTTTTLIVGPDKPVTPGESCLDATRFGWICHD